MFFDAADITGAPGDMEDIDLFSTEDCPSFSTHTLPLKIIADYLKESTGAEFTVIGVKPKTTDFGEGLSQEIEKAIIDIVDVFKKT